MLVVPTEDYKLAMSQEKRVDLSRIQRDLEARRARQEAREREARAQREAKELEGCTFAPQLISKKRRQTRTTSDQQQPSMMEASEPVAHQNMAGNKENALDYEGLEMDRFLRDQKRYEEERKQRQARLVAEQEEEERKMKSTKMNPNSRRILERRMRNAENGVADQQQPAEVNSSRIAKGKAVASAEPARRTRAERQPTKVPTNTVTLSAVASRVKSEEPADSSFAPKLNKKSIQLAQAKREGVTRIEDHLIRQAEAKKRRNPEETKTAQPYAHLRKLSDKYILQKFAKEFDQALAMVCSPPVDSSAGQEQATQPEEAKTAKNLNYLRFKEFLVEMCFMTEQQATTDTAENALAFELWELVAPRVSRALDQLSDQEDEEEAMRKIDEAYVTEVQAQQVAAIDLRTVTMAILRLNDGKRFMAAQDAPMPQSEGEIGFRLALVSQASDGQ